MKLKREAKDRQKHCCSCLCSWQEYRQVYFEIQPR